jgi:hypothetical protein
MQHTFIISLPRSGSTVLTRMFSSRDDVVSLPETFFPHLLDHLSRDEWQDSHWVAALFVVSCSDGSPLTLDEAMECITDSQEESLRKIALKVAAKDGRDADSIKAAVWKATRLVGSHTNSGKLGGRVVILHRPRLNVYESQFRVPFGDRNRNACRFALFAASYDAAFRHYSAAHTIHVEYARIPEQIDAIFSPAPGLRECYKNLVSFEDILYPIPYPEVLPNQWREPDVSPVKLLFIGANLRRKAGDVLIDKWRMKAPKNCTLTIVSPEAKGSPPAGAVFLNGITSNTPEHKLLLEEHAIFILPTRRDAYGFAALEALNFGQVVVTTQFAGIASLVLEAAA